MQRTSLKKLAAGLVLLLDKYPVRAVAQATAEELMRQRRTREAEGLLAALGQEWWRQRGELPATVTTARPMTAAVRAKISGLLKKVAPAKRVEITAKVDPAVIGGWRAETAAMTIEATVPAQLKALARHG